MLITYLLYVYIVLLVSGELDMKEDPHDGTPRWFADESAYLKLLIILMKYKLNISM